MAEIRKFDPTAGNGDIQRQVRDLLGEHITAIQPGEPSPSGTAVDPDPQPEYLVQFDDAERIEFDWH